MQIVTVVVSDTVLSPSGTELDPTCEPTDGVTDLGFDDEVDGSTIMAVVDSPRLFTPVLMDHVRNVLYALEELVEALVEHSTVTVVVTSGTLLAALPGLELSKAADELGGMAPLETLACIDEPPSVVVDVIQVEWNSPDDPDLVTGHGLESRD